jgi:hypothetical protein
VPRHPPSALDNLTTQNKPQKTRCSRPLCNSQPTTNPQPTTRHQHREPATGMPPGHAWQHRNNNPGPTARPGCSLRTQQGAHHPPQPHRAPFPTPQGAVLGRRRPLPGRTRQCLRPRAPHHHIRAARAPTPGFPGQVLLRKEVIQPHLPVRLPCYDFVPIASPTFDGSLPYGLGHRLRVLPTFVT